MRLIEEPDLPPRLDVTSLIDVTFSILAFFILSTLFLAQNLGVPVNLPRADTATLQKSVRVAVSINPQGELFFNQEQIPITQLEQRIITAKKQAQGQELVVLIQADEATPHGRVVDVMDRLRQIQGIRMALATRR
ncbi:MAG: ExbD/TolR family protein [Pseudanabaenaceae cyanobacterium]